MALKQDITAESLRWFTGEDKRLTFAIYGSDAVVDENGVVSGTPQDVSGWTFSWMVKRNPQRDADALIAKSTSHSEIEIVGTYDADPAVNTQRVRVEITDDDLAALRSGVAYYHELKRTDPGLETVLAHGTLVLAQAVHRE